jgi:hypothetical protein
MARTKIRSTAIEDLHNAWKAVTTEQRYEFIAAKYDEIVAELEHSVQDNAENQQKFDYGVTIERAYEDGSFKLTRWDERDLPPEFTRLVDKHAPLLRALLAGEAELDVRWNKGDREATVTIVPEPEPEPDESQFKKVRLSFPGCGTVTPSNRN